MNSVLNTRQMLIIFISVVFIMFTNIVDLYSMFVDINRWVPVNTSPMSIGDEYHYFSILKMVTFGELDSVPNMEYSRVVPYIINVPVYYIGSLLFDTRYGILFVRFFDMGLLFFSLYYFIKTINHLNGWKENIYIYILTIFIVFYGFYGFRTLFISTSFHSIYNAISHNLFIYLGDNSFIYDHSTISSLARAINASTTAPIILFIFTYRLKSKTFTLLKLIVFLIILMFTSLSAAVAFGLFSILLDVLNKVKLSEIIKNIIFGILLGVTIILLQNKIMFSLTESAQEVINLGFHFRFKLVYFTAPLVAIFIVLVGRQYISRPVLIMLVVLSLFQPLAYMIGGAHWSRLWIRSTIIPYISIVVYLSTMLIYYSIDKLLYKNANYRKIILIFITSGLIFIFGRFGWSNAVYVEKHNERFVNKEEVIAYLLKEKEPSIIITNSPQIALLAQIYDRYSKPLMGHYSLQSDGYKKNLARTIVNFELLGVKEEVLIYNIDKEAPRRTWLRKREGIKLDSDDFKKYYFDEILFMSTYVSYNKKMLIDNIKSKSNFLNDSFYKIRVEKKSVYLNLENKKTIFLIDQLMPFAFKE